MRQQTHQHQIGKFFLSELSPKYPNYRICWYEGRQTRGFTTGTAQLEDALVALAKHAEKELLAARNRPAFAADGSPLPKDPPKANMRLVDAMNQYKTAVLDLKPKKRSNKGGGNQTAFAGALRELLAIWGDPWVSELDRKKQLEYIRVMREERPDPVKGRRYVDETIIKFLGMYWTAMNYAADEKVLSRDAIPTKIDSEQWGPVINVRKVEHVDLALIGKLMNVASRHERWWRGMVKKVGTAARPSAAMELTPAQVNFETMTLDLRVPGTPEPKKKRRPTIPLSRHLAWHLRQWMYPKDGEPMQPTESFQTWNGQPVLSDNWFYDVAREAGVKCNPYLIRHFLGKWIALKERDSGWERDSFMGHVPTGSRTGRRYTQFNPRQQRGAADSVDALFEALAPYVTARPLIDISLGTDGLEDQPIPTLYTPTPEGSGRTMLVHFSSSEAPTVPSAWVTPRNWDGAWHERGTPESNFEENEAVMEGGRLPDKEPDRG